MADEFWLEARPDGGFVRHAGRRPETGRFEGPPGQPTVLYIDGRDVENRSLAYEGWKQLRVRLDLALAEERAQALRRALSEVARG